MWSAKERKAARSDVVRPKALCHLKIVRLERCRSQWLPDEYLTDLRHRQIFVAIAVATHMNVMRFDTFGLSGLNYWLAASAKVETMAGMVRYPEKEALWRHRNNLHRKTLGEAAERKTNQCFRF